jgi:membrane-associated phospholipid phosphatase
MGMRLPSHAAGSVRSTSLAPGRPVLGAGWKVVTARLAGGAVVLFGLICLIGELLIHFESAGPAHRADLGVDSWLAAHRTSGGNTATLIGTTLAQTETVIAVTAVLVLVLRWRLGRWRESLFLIAVMAGELAVFLSVTAVVHQSRPPVARLDPAPSTSSYPSGHTAAAVALYGGIAVLALWIYGRRPATVLASVLLGLVPFYVGFSRLYRGMHYPSDVLAGALLGGAWLIIVTTTLLPRPGRPSRRRPSVRRT